MMPSTISGHAQAWDGSVPERRARSARAVNDSQNAPSAMSTVPATAVMTAMRPPRRRITGTEVRTDVMRAPAQQCVVVGAEGCPDAHQSQRTVWDGWCGRQSGSSLTLPVTSVLHAWPQEQEQRG